MTGAPRRSAVPTSDSRHNALHFWGTTPVSTFDVTAVHPAGNHHHGSGLNQFGTVLSVPCEPVDSALTVRRGLPQGLIPQ